MNLDSLGNNAGNLKDYINLIMKSKNNIIFFGSCGAGKTTLVNKLCESSFETYTSTKNPQCAQSRRKGDFIAIDFPPFDSNEDQLTNYKIHKKILSLIPIRMICFIVKYEMRYDLMIQKILALKEIFEDYKDNTLIILTQCDLVLYGKMFEIEMIIEKKMGYKKIISSFKNMDDAMLNNLYDRIVNNMNKTENITQMIIKSVDLINNMNTLNYNLFDKDINNFKETLSLFEEKSKEYENNENVQRALFFVLKSYKNNYTKKLIKPFINTIKNFSDVDKLILELISFCKKIRININNLIGSFKVGIQLGIYDELYEQTFRKCHHCGTIWSKYYGQQIINGCGKRGKIEVYNIIETENYMVKFQDGKFIIEKDLYRFRPQNKWCFNYYNDEVKDFSKTRRTRLDFPTNPWLLKAEEKKFNELKERNDKALIQPIGCANRLYWNELEDVTSEIIKKFEDSLLKNYTEFYSDVFEIEQELKIFTLIEEIKNIKFSSKNEISLGKDNEIIYSEILKLFEEYNKIQENLELIVEYSSVLIKTEGIKNQNHKKFYIREIISLLNQIGYYFDIP